MELQYDILDDKRRALLRLFAPLKEDGWYLAGGTALALMFGHRDSVDFDFFTKEPFDTQTLLTRLQSLFHGHELLKTQEEDGTLSVEIDGDVRTSFFAYPYPLVQPAIETEYFSLASVEDIACMKLSAITGRAAFKDYVDLYFILEKLPLKSMLANLREKMPQLDPLLALKSLAYLDDLAQEPIAFKTKPVSLADIRARLMSVIAAYPDSA